LRSNGEVPLRDFQLGEINKWSWRWIRRFRLVPVSAFSMASGKSLTRNRDSRWTCPRVLHFSKIVNQEPVQPARGESDRSQRLLSR
jgi:hypothetical protein